MLAKLVDDEDRPPDVDSADDLVLPLLDLGTLPVKQEVFTPGLRGNLQHERDEMDDDHGAEHSIIVEVAAAIVEAIGQDEIRARLQLIEKVIIGREAQQEPEKKIAPCMAHEIDAFPSRIEDIGALR